MVRRWHGFKNPWDREYAMRGDLWRGVEDATFLTSRIDPDARVLELGCGDGKFLAGLATARYRAVGVDFSRHALRRASGRVKAPLVLADGRALPFRDASIPAVIARYVLGAQLARGRSAMAGEIERVTAPGGLLLVEEFSVDDFRSGTGQLVEPGTYERNRGITTHYFGREEVPTLFTRLKLEETVELRSLQKTGASKSPRHRWRWIFRRRPSL